MGCTYRVIKKYTYVGYGICVHRWLDRQYPGHWVGHRGPMEWKPRSVDLFTLDFYSWRHLKAMVCLAKVQNMDHLKEHIGDACAYINTRYVKARSPLV